MTRWRSNARTKGLRVPAVLTLGGCCEAFATPRHEARKDDVEAERFLWAFRDAAIRLRQDPDAEPEPIVEECPRDSTLDIENPETRSEANTVGFVRFNSRLLDCSFFPTREPLPIEVRTALIVVASIGLLRPIREGAPRLPFVATLLLANGYGRVLAVFESGPQDGAALPPGVVDYGGKRTLAADMCKFILEHLGNNNVLVGFHLA